MYDDSERRTRWLSATRPERRCCTRFDWRFRKPDPVHEVSLRTYHCGHQLTHQWYPGSWPRRKSIGTFARLINSLVMVYSGFPLSKSCTISGQISSPTVGFYLNRDWQHEASESAECVDAHESAGELTLGDVTRS
jgi:hypothetical protein